MKIIDIAIVGAGPAGLSAAIYAKQAGYNVEVYKASDPSLIATTDRVSNYLGLGDVSGAELYKSLTNHVKLLEIPIISNRVDEIHKTSAGFELLSLKGIVQAKAVVYAAGSKPKKLGIPGEDCETVSYCATCDGGFYEGDPRLLVVGGGDSAAEEALYLAELVGEVKLLVRSELRAKHELAERVSQKENIEVIAGVSTTTVEFDGGAELILNTVRDGVKEPYRASGMFVAIGQIPTTGPVEGLVVFDDAGFVEEVLVEGLFIAGDLNSKNARQAIIAAGDGANAGIKASDYVRELA